MKKLSILALVLLSSTAAFAQTKPKTEDIKTYVNNQITDAVTQLSRTDGDLQTQIKTLEQQVVELSAMVEAANLNNFAVYFASNSNTLSAEEVANLAPVIEFLQKNPATKVTIAGHADERGTREYNIELGNRRALAVRQILADNGISNDRIGVLSYGKERPVCIDSDEGCWKINRRVQFSIRF
jgi:peptidoglycan-associated lipoprotein